MSSRMERPKPGARSISLLASNVSTIWFTDGGVTPKYRSMSASAAGRRRPLTCGNRECCVQNLHPSTPRLFSNSPETLILIFNSPISHSYSEILSYDIDDGGNCHSVRNLLPRHCRSAFSIHRRDTRLSAEQSQTDFLRYAPFR